MKPTKRIRLMGALHSVVRKHDAEVREADRKKVSERNRQNAKKALPRISEKEKIAVRARWERVLRDLPDHGNRPRYTLMRHLLDTAKPRIENPGTLNFGNWLKLRI